LPFKKGAFHLAIQSGCPIIPVVCENYSKLMKQNKYLKRGSLQMKSGFSMLLQPQLTGQFLLLSRLLA
jgi:1-acyl-sn-glycerol-3-phosphate acyltransferase